MKRKVLNKILKNPMSITGNAEWDARLNELLYDDDIEYVKQGLGIADTFGVLEEVVSEMIIQREYGGNTIYPTKRDKWITLALLELQESNDQPFFFWEHYTELDLSQIGMTELPDSIKYLKNITYLRLNYNKLTKLPDGITKLKKLREFECMNNKLKKLPSNIGDLSNLVYLFLDNNHITSFPSSMANLADTLTTLEISGNPIDPLSQEYQDLKDMLPNTYINEYWY